MKIQINEHVSQWQTVEHLADWLDNNDIELPESIIDIGAADGKLNSNSWNFIVDNDWEGLLVEPNPEAVKQIYENYKDLRRRVNVIEAAVTDHTGTTILFLPNDKKDDQLASLTNWHRQHPMQLRTFEVKAILPSDLPIHTNDIGILTIDTEGNDFRILELWRIQQRPWPRVIITESWPHLGYQNIQKQSLLGRVGYKKVLHHGENEIFYKE